MPKSNTSITTAASSFKRLSNEIYKESISDSNVMKQRASFLEKCYQLIETEFFKHKGFHLTSKTFAELCQSTYI